MYYQTLVYPGIGADLHTPLDLIVLITDDFPTFGYPINPTLTVFLSLWN